MEMRNNKKKEQPSEQTGLDQNLIVQLKFQQTVQHQINLLVHVKQDFHKHQI